MTSRSKPQKIGAILEGFLSETGYLAVCKEYDILRRWPERVGERVAEATACDRVEDGVLYVRASSAAWRQELSYLKHRILGKIRASTECTTLRDIIFF